MSQVTASKRKKEEEKEEASSDLKENVITKSISEGEFSHSIGCFELKMHHSTSDSSHNSAVTTLAKLLNLFRSKSDPTVKSGSKSDPAIKLGSAKSRSKSHSKTRNASPSPAAAPRRRFVRVVRDAEARAPEVIDDNPHVVCRYSQSFLEEHYLKSQEELSNRPLPYTTSGHTILKKSSTDPTPSCEQHSPTVGKHATFKELVEVIEFSGQDVLGDGAHTSHEARLHDEDVSPDEERETGFFLRHDTTSSETDNVADQDNESTIASSEPEEEADIVSAKVPPVDLDRMDGIMKNIFSSVANVHEASPEPPKIRRVELSELINRCAPEERHENVKSSKNC